MDKRGLLAILPFFSLLCLPHTVCAQERYIEEGGVTYKETRRVIRRPVTSTHLEAREKLVYRQQVNTELRETVRTYPTPVTEYRWVTRMRGRWNPFIQPYYAHDLVPTTRWEYHGEVQQIPVTRREWIPEKRTVQVPITVTRMADEEIISRVAVSGTPPSLAGRSAVGGMARLESDPPRQGVSGSWKAARSVLR